VAGLKIWHGSGLRQGDPLSPCFLIIVMGALSLFLIKLKLVGLIEPLTNEETVPQCLSVYADIVRKASPEECNTVRYLLDVFGVPSALHCIMAKSSISLIYCDTLMIEDLSSPLDCHISNVPITYLGFPLPLRKILGIGFSKMN
jgi:hypothetical protein